MNNISKTGKKIFARSKNSGFTLVELIVVLVILAILAAILIPALLGYIDEARKKEDIVNAKALMTALQTSLTEEYGKHTSNFSSMLAKDKDIIMCSKDNKAQYESFTSGVFDKTGIDPNPFLLLFYTRKVDKEDYHTKDLSVQRGAFTCYSVVYWRTIDSMPVYYDFVNNQWGEGNPYSDDLVVRGDNIVQDGPLKNEKIRVCVVAGTSKKLTANKGADLIVKDLNNMIMKKVDYKGTLNKNGYDSKIKIE